MTKEQLIKELKELDNTDKEQKSDIEVFPVYDIENKKED